MYIISHRYFTWLNGGGADLKVSSNNHTLCVFRISADHLLMNITKGRKLLHRQTVT